MRGLRVLPAQPLDAVVMVAVFGILNVTRDSFSDGGRYFDAAAAVAHAEELVAGGADVVDVGAESTHPDAEDVAPDEEIRRLGPVVAELVRRGIAVSVDTRKPAVMRAMVGAGASWLNDVNGFRSADSMAAAAAAPRGVRFVAMFSRSATGRAERGDDRGSVCAEVTAFFAERIAAFAKAGVDRDRLVLDPGMGFFLGRTPAPSLEVLRRLPELVAAGGPLLVSVSRKSFLGTIAGGPMADRGPATLAAETWAVRNGAAFVRTHDPRALRAALAVEHAIATAPSGVPKGTS
ncbi:MAG: dihydropteroate synthase [Planctomycetes bacterium]|nr:dihydropteroate synthase [Planctomycetota bacterium]